MKEPIIKIREINDKELKEILENNDIIHVEENNLDDVFKKIDKKLKLDKKKLKKQR